MFQVSRLGNGTVIASLENNGPVAQVALLVNAGPRHEPAGQLGLTSCLRSAVGLVSQFSGKPLVAYRYSLWEHKAVSKCFNMLNI